MTTDNQREDLDLAIIGMAGRFPGACNIERFWRNLSLGVESITTYTDEQLLAMGVDPVALRDPKYVKAGALLDDIDLFDASFFGYSPREAEMMDPQHRLFLECAWEAFEDAGHCADLHEKTVGVFTGASLSSYLLFNVLGNLDDSYDTFSAMIGNDKDFLSTRVSYKFNLKGPSVNVQTACSTSLVAVHFAAQNLLSYQCDLAVAGGVSIHMPQRTGYFYQEEGINSPDGHCRAFDARAAGAVFGSGVGVVIIKRLADALEDGDTIHAVLKGSAINNDGSAKIGYTAPSLEGQAQVISLAQMIAGVHAESIGYIESHGTGTALGDPVEIAALTKAFRERTALTGFCAVGSVKTNVGHLDAAAGVTGLIKAILALKHKVVPPTLHFEKPNPAINFADSPFYVATELKEWKRKETPRRAGVSSFGIGGTNAHVILEEAPPPPISADPRSRHLFLLSAKSADALQAATAGLAEYLRQRPETNLADAAYTLQVGRRVFEHRRALVCRDLQEAVGLLETADPKQVFTQFQEADNRRVAFMFPGGGAQYLEMGSDLYREEPVFRERLDQCADLLATDLGFDLRHQLYPVGDRDQVDTADMNRTSLGLPALFAVEYALAELWMSWGIRPQAMIGHSLGEYAAACLSGVFSLKNALSLVVMRARLFERLPKGSMLSVSLGEQEIRGLLDPELSIAAINGPSQCVVSGPGAAIERAASRFAEQDIEFSRLHIDVAAHSQMVTPILEEFTRFLATLELHPPQIPYLSNVTGDWITEAEATSLQYWGEHLRRTVRFEDGVKKLIGMPEYMLLEVGPGQTLSTLAKLQADSERAQSVVASMRHPYDRQSDVAVLLRALGKLWLGGARIDWNAFNQEKSRRRISLPTYPFERRKYWLSPPGELSPSRLVRRDKFGKSLQIADWFYLPSWRQTLPPRVAAHEERRRSEKRWLVLTGQAGVGTALFDRIKGTGADTIRVEPGMAYHRAEVDRYIINPTRLEDYETLLRSVVSEIGEINEVLHLWNIDGECEGFACAPDFFSKAQELGFYSLIYLARALSDNLPESRVGLWIIADKLLAVESNKVIRPEKATLIGPCRVIPQEYENINAKIIDITVDEAENRSERVIERILAEIEAESEAVTVAYRGNKRWEQVFEHVRLTDDYKATEPLREGEAFMITGGLGGIGLLLAERLAEKFKSKLALTARTPFPAREEWEQRSKDQDKIGDQIRRLMAIERSGAEIFIAAADVADEGAMRRVMQEAVARFGKLRALIHLAGDAGEKALKLIPQITDEDCERQFQAKVRGLYVLEKIVSAEYVDSCVLFSSNAATLGGLGSGVYSAANLFMDAFAAERDGKTGALWTSVAWDGWLLNADQRQISSYQTSLDRYAMTPDESLETFERIVTSGVSGQLIVSTGELVSRMNLWVKNKTQTNNAPSAHHPRPKLNTDYTPPQNEIEQTIAAIWGDLLGVDQPGVNDNFFELGGNSLISLKVISRLKKELNRDLPLVMIFERPTIKALAEAINGAGRSKDANLYEDSRQRGERRRQKRERKSHAD